MIQAPTLTRLRHVIRTRRRALLGVLALLLVATSALFLTRHHVLRLALDLPAFTHTPGSRLEIALPMTDGVRLHTEVWLPEGSGPWPALLIRSPYNVVNVNGQLCRLLSRYGYACVSQDVRGRYGSEGQWQPLQHERADGLDTLHWMIEQPWQNDHIAMLGLSYLAGVQWALADALPPEVKTLVPAVFSTDLYGLAYQGGMFRHDIVSAWAAVMPERYMRFESAWDYQDFIRHRPFATADERYLGRPVSWLRDMVNNPGRDDAFWQRDDMRALATVPERVQVPVLMFGGWYDFSIGSMVDTFAKLPSRARSKLIIGGWNHLQLPDGDLRPEADLAVGAQAAVVLDWLGHHLKGEPLDQPTGVVESYIFGADAWRTWEQWPPSNATPRRWHLDHLAAAQTCTGGSLSTEPPTARQEIVYRYDPTDPAPSRGGAGLAFALPFFGGLKPGVVRQDGLCERDDVLTFVTAPLAEPLHIVGRPRVRLTVASSAADTAFTVKLLQVNEDGAAYNIHETITSLAYRNGARTPQPYAPGTPVTLDLELPPIEWVLNPGMRLRLDVSSASFPAFEAHANLPGPWSRHDHTVVAEQHVLAGGEASAHVEVPAL